MPAGEVVAMMRCFDGFDSNGGRRWKEENKDRR